MKRLTINRIAGAGMRQNKRGYFSLAVGIFLSVFLITALCLCIHGIALARNERVYARVGYENALILDTKLSDSDLWETGYFSRIGHIYVTAEVTDTGKYLGYYDEEGAALLNRSLTEGRMPERAGEIAIEQSALEVMRLEAGVGDTLEFPLTPLDGAAETRAFTLVGVLNEQSVPLDVSRTMSSTHFLKLPAILIHPDEAAFSTGRIAVHCPAVTRSQAALYSLLATQFGGKSPLSREVLYGISGTGEPITFNYDILDADLAEKTMPYVFLGGALLLAACVGIAGAMESQLSRKTEEIAMLRAVGATKRQIRRIFGRESWLLALLLSPLSILFACLAVWGLSRLSPDGLIFKPEIALLLPIALLSCVTILLSAWLPLRRAARIMPMQAMRNTDMLRKARKIASKEQFSAPALISRRQLRMRPTRLIGASALVMLMVVIIGMVVPIASYSAGIDGERQPDFSLYPHQSWSYSRGYFADDIPNVSLSQSDLAQLAALSNVQKVNTMRHMTVILPIEEGKSADYFKYNARSSNNGHLLSEEAYDDLYNKENKILRNQIMLETMRQVTGIKGNAVAVELCVTVLDPQALANNVAFGRINLEAVNAGEEVLVYAPDVYYKSYDNMSITRYSDTGEADWDAVYLSDYFTAGQTLPLVHLWFPMQEEGPDIYSGTEKALRSAFLKNFESMNREDVSVTVGAVLMGEAAGIGGPGIISTEQGMRAMGLEPGEMAHIDIFTSGRLDEEAEKELERRIETIAMRGDMEVINHLKIRREERAQRERVTMALGAVVIVLFAAAAGMIVGNVTRQLRADRRMIGTLRALGADRRAIHGCYAGQIRFSVLAGTGIGALLVALLISMGMLNGVMPDPGRTALLIAVAVAAFSLLTLLTCLFMLRLRIREIAAGSIIDHIREL